VSTLDAIARESGTFAMVAMDQRESLPTMLREHGKRATDAHLERFKLGVVCELAPYASGFLIDKDHVDAVEPFVEHGLILAVDRLVQEPGGVVEDTSADENFELVPGVVALKLLVIWRDDERRAERVELSQRFVELARGRGVLSVLEPIVRVPEDEREDAIVEAAHELGSVGPSLYKCQVPLYGRGEGEEITKRAKKIDAALPVPWVVLSQGVDPDDFPRRRCAPPATAARRASSPGERSGRSRSAQTIRKRPSEPSRCRGCSSCRQSSTCTDVRGARKEQREPPGLLSRVRAD
jgi:sulfofructosephosphate aldolase